MSLPDEPLEVRKTETPGAEPASGEAARAHEHVALPTLLAAASAPVTHRPGLDNVAPKVGSTVKHYELLRTLGEGGMGTVYLARDTKLGRLVAIKVLQLHAGPSTERFLIEAQATARCRHDNIVVIHEVDEVQGNPFMVLEYLEGRTLREWMAERDSASGQVSPSLVVELMLPVVRALACAHQQGIVHRDLKPENIFLTKGGRVVVLDFGIAKRLGVSELSAITATARMLARSTGLTKDGALLGTLPYMSPEQLRMEDIDVRSDQWAVGIILFELVTGAHPLARRSVFQFLEMADSQEPMPRVRDRRPDVGGLGAIIDRCLQKDRADRYRSAEELLSSLEGLALGGKPRPLGEEESPFAGLSAFQEADADRYVGREHEIASLTGRLRNQPLVVVAGPSGAGKSSFVRAGVIPALKRSGEGWEAFILRPGRRPLAALADVLAQIRPALEEDAPAGIAAASATEALLEALRAQPGLVGAQLRARCRRGGDRHRLLLFVDQFEELYTLCADAAERAAVVACLEGAADDASSPLRVVLSLRSDFLYRVAEEGHFRAEVTRGLLFLPPMARDGLHTALVRPLEVAGYRFENEAMVDAMLAGLERTKSPLPLLQFTAAKLWEARDRAGRLLTQASYDQLGGVAGALSAHANAVLSALSPADQRLCRAVFLRLCTPERTRAVVSLTDLRGLAADGGAVEHVIHRLSDARLVLVEAGGEEEGTMVELCHESLIESWNKLTQWLSESERDAQFLAGLGAAAQQWEASQEAPGLLWRDRAAREAAEWLARRRAEQANGEPLGLGRREERFLIAVVALFERGRRRRQRIVAGVVATLSAIAVAMFLLSISVNRQAARADQAAKHAEEEALAAQVEARQARNATRTAAARELEQSDPGMMLVVLREIEPPEVPRGWAELVSKALRSGVLREMRTFVDRGVLDAAFSPDGQRIVAALHDGARVWKVGDTAEPIVFEGHEDKVWSAAFSPDGTRIVTASGDKTARIWPADGSGQPIVLRGHGGEVVSAAFSPDGTHVVTASWDRTVRIWKADGLGQPIVFYGPDEFGEVAWDPDGRRIVAACHDKTARVWNADGSGQPIVLRGHEGPVGTAAFSPDGQHIVTGAADTTVRVWNADGSGRPIVLRGHEQGIGRARFSPDGKYILTASRGLDRTLRVWSVDGIKDTMVLHGPDNWANTAAWSPDGSSIVTSSPYETIRVFDIDLASLPVVLRGHKPDIGTVGVSPDNQRVVAVESDIAMVWNVDGSGEPIVLRGHEGKVEDAVFSPDNRHIVTTSDDKTARVWNTDGSGRPVILRGHEQEVTAADWSPDSHRIVTVSLDKTMRIWNADGSGQPVVLRGHEQGIGWVRFSPDGKRIATWAKDDTTRIWNADGSGDAQIYRGVKAPRWSPDGIRIGAGCREREACVWSIDRPEQPLVLQGHEQTVYKAVWSPDGKHIVTSSRGKIARIWNADGSGPPVVLRGHEREIRVAAFGPDGERIATASTDMTVRIWNVDGSGEPYVLNPEKQLIQMSWSPDGTRIVTRTDDASDVQVWPVRAPLRGPDDPRLWIATSYCMSIERRIALLRVSEARAQADQKACERRVRTTHHNAT